MGYVSGHRAVCTRQLACRSYLWVRALRVARGVAGLMRARRAHALTTPAHAQNGTVASPRCNNVFHFRKFIFTSSYIEEDQLNIQFISCHYQNAIVI